MFYLGGTNFPATREDLAAAVTEGLRGLFTLPPGRQIVKFEAGSAGSPQAGSASSAQAGSASSAQAGSPATADNGAMICERVMVDLTGASADAEKLPPEPKGVGQSRPAVVAGRLEVGAHPLTVRGAPIDLTLSASNAQFNYDRDAAGHPLLLLADARDGRVTIEIRRRDLDTLVLAAAREAAGKQGVQIIETQLALTQTDDRSVSAEVRLKAKKMFITAIVTVRGKLTIDQALNATTTDLSCSGEGMLGDLACGVIRPRLQEINGRSFPLTALSLGAVRLRDLRLRVGETLVATAGFGG